MKRVCIKCCTPNYEISRQSFEDIKPQCFVFKHFGPIKLFYRKGIVKKRLVHFDLNSKDQEQDLDTGRENVNVALSNLFLGIVGPF